MECSQSTMSEPRHGARRRRFPARRGRSRSRAPSTLRLGPDLHQRAALSATAHGVSLNSWIKQAVEEKASR